MSAESSSQEEGKPQCCTIEQEGSTALAAGVRVSARDAEAAALGDFAAAGASSLWPHRGGAAEPPDLGTVYVSSRAFLERLARHRGVPDDEIDDCIHDAWLCIIRQHALGRFDPALGTLRDWAAAIARRKVGRWAARRARHRTEQVPVDEGEPLVSAGDAASSLLARAELRAEIDRALGLLKRRVTPGSYEVFYMRGVERRTVGQVALALRIPAERARCIHWRVQAAFFRVFKELYGNPFE